MVQKSGNHHLGCKKTCTVNLGYYPYQLVRDSISRMDLLQVTLYLSTTSLYKSNAKNLSSANRKGDSTISSTATRPLWYSMKSCLICLVHDRILKMACYNPYISGWYNPLIYSKKTGFLATPQLRMAHRGAFRLLFFVSVSGETVTWKKPAKHGRATWRIIPQPVCLVSS